MPNWNQDAAATAQAIVDGVELALYQDTRFKSEPDDKPKVEQVDLIGLAGQDAAIDHARKVCSGVFLARELVAAPANFVTPITLADTAQAGGRRYPPRVNTLHEYRTEIASLQR